MKKVTINELCYWFSQLHNKKLTVSNFLLCYDPSEYNTGYPVICQLKSNKIRSEKIEDYLLEFNNVLYSIKLTNKQPFIILLTPI